MTKKIVTMGMVAVALLVALATKTTVAQAAMSQKAAPLPPVAVYVVEPTAEFQDQALKDRHDTWKDLRGRFQPKLVRVVDSRDEAKLVVEVVSRAQGAAGGVKLTQDSVRGKLGTKPLMELTVVVKLSFGDYSTEIVGKDTERNELLAVPSWNSAARDAADQIEKWIKANRAKLN